MPDKRKRDMKKQSDWSRAYNSKSYDRLYPFVPKGRKAEIQAAADALGETLNEFIVKAIDQRMEPLRDVWDKPDMVMQYKGKDMEFKIIDTTK